MPSTKDVSDATSAGKGSFAALWKVMPLSTTDGDKEQQLYSNSLVFKQLLLSEKEGIKRN